MFNCRESVSVYTNYLSKQSETNGRFTLFTRVPSFVLVRVMYVSHTVVYFLKLLNSIDNIRTVRQYASVMNTGTIIKHNIIII